MEGRFIGYLQGHAGYRILLKDGWILKSKDVEFLEDPPHRTNMIAKDNDDAAINPMVPLVATTDPAVETETKAKITEPMATQEDAKEGEESLNDGAIKGGKPVGEYWIPCHEKRVPKLTEKVRAAMAKSSPTTEDIVKLNRELDTIIEGMTSGFQDLHAP